MKLGSDRFGWMEPRAEFSGKKILITGSGSGIGRATALAFARHGSHLVLCGRNAANLGETGDLAQSAGAAQVDLEVVNLCEAAAVEALFQRLDRFDVAVNNAGIEGRIDDTTHLTLADFDEVMNINVRALWHCLKLEVGLLRRLGRPGAIVNVSSVAGLIGIPTSSLYVASKHAVIGFTKAVALEQIRNGIRVNALCPGSVETPMLNRIFPTGLESLGASHPIGRLATPDEMAEAILWLASEKSSYVVGHSLVVDGGRSIE